MTIDTEQCCIRSRDSTAALYVHAQPYKRDPLSSAALCCWWCGHLLKLPASLGGGGASKTPASGFDS